MKTDTKTKITNNLWQARKRGGLDRKQVAFLLSQKTTNPLAIYESGYSLPTLKNALRLEIIYRTPVRLLFQDLFEKLQSEIAEKRKKDSEVSPAGDWFPKHAEQLKQEEFCFYADILKSRMPGRSEIELINKHVVALMNTVSDYRQGRNPFSQ